MSEWAKISVFAETCHPLRDGVGVRDDAKDVCREV